MKSKRIALIYLLGMISLFLMACPVLSVPNALDHTAEANPWVKGSEAPSRDDPYGGRVVFTTIPFTCLTMTIDGKSVFLPVVEVRIGTIKANFVVDTGTIATGITTSLAKRLGLTPKPLLPKEGQIPVRSIDAVTMPTMQMGDINFTPTLVEVFSDSVWNRLDMNLDGIIGVHYLEACMVEFDFPSRRLTFLNPHAVTPKMRQRAGYGASSYDAEITEESSGFYKATLEMMNGKNQVSEPVIIDTGSYTSMISAKAAGSLHLSAIGPSVEYGGLRKPQAFMPARVDQLRVGQLSLANAQVRYPQKDDPAAVPPVLGMDILSGYKVLMDFPGKKMYFQSPVTALPNVQVKTPAAVPSHQP